MVDLVDFLVRFLDGLKGRPIEEVVSELKKRGYYEEHPDYGCSRTLSTVIKKCFNDDCWWWGRDICLIEENGVLKDYRISESP